MLDLWLRIIGSLAAKLVHGTQKDVEQKEVMVVSEEERTKTAKELLKQAKARKTKAQKISRALSDDKSN
jgi:hypothetical protein